MHTILAIELLLTCTGVDLRRQQDSAYATQRLGHGTSRLHNIIRAQVPLVPTDHVLTHDIQRVRDMAHQLACVVDHRLVASYHEPLVIDSEPAFLRHRTPPRTPSAAEAWDDFEPAALALDDNTGGAAARPAGSTAQHLGSAVEPADSSDEDEHTEEKKGEGADAGKSTGSSSKVLATPCGTLDYLPKDMLIREDVISRITRFFRLHGALPLDTPVMEYSDNIKKPNTLGEQSTLVFDLVKHGQRGTCLRYDLTVPFSRVVAQHDLHSFKRYHIGKVYRRDAPSLAKGRLREFMQCDIDFAGGGDLMVADADMLSVFVDVLVNLVGADTFVVRLSDRRLLQALLALCDIPERLIKTTCSSIDKLDKLSWADVAVELRQKGLSQIQIDTLRTYICHDDDSSSASVPTSASSTSFTASNHALVHWLRTDERAAQDATVQATLTELELLLAYLASFGCDARIKLDLSLARGLDYYTGVIFEAYVVERENGVGVGSIGAGGRYDDLIQSFHPRQQHIPAVGASIGIERIFALYTSQAAGRSRPVSALSTSCLVSPVGGNVPITVIMSLCGQLRAAGISTDFTYKLQTDMKAQTERALKDGYRLMVQVGETELAADTVIIKPVVHKHSGEGEGATSKRIRPERHTISRSEMVQFVKEYLTRAQPE